MNRQPLAFDLTGFRSRGRVLVFALLTLVLTRPSAIAQPEPVLLNLGATGAVLSEPWVAYSVDEPLSGNDLNGDGDTEDRVVHVRHLTTGETTNLGISVLFLGGLFGASPWLVFGVLELDRGEDLNGDGDVEDGIVHVHNLATGEGNSLGLAVRSGNLRRVSEDHILLEVSERLQGQDLNGDGDTEDYVLHIHDLGHLG